MFEFDEVEASERSLIELLLQREAISREHLTEAIEFQCRLPRSQVITLDRILVDMEYLRQQDLDAAKHALGLDIAPNSELRRNQLAEATLDLSSLFDATAAPIPGPAPDIATPQDLEALFAPSAMAEAPDLAALFDTDATEPLDLAMLFGAQPAAEPASEGPPLVPELAALFQDAPSAPPSPPPPSPPPQAFAPPPANPPAPAVPQAEPLPPAPVAADPAPVAADPAPVAAAPSPPPASPPLPQGVRAAGAFAQRNLPGAGGWGQPVMPPQPTPAAPPPPVAPPRPELPEDASKIPRPQLGEILLQNHDLEEWQLTHALCLQREAPQTTPKLGTLLVKLGYVEAQAVQRALGSQQP